MSTPVASPERPPGPQFTIPTWSRQAPPAPMANGSPKTAPAPPRRLEPIIVSSEPARPSRSLADWMILAGMFIFLVILSHGQMTTANELKKLNERMGPAQLGVSPATAPPPPYPVGVPYPPPSPSAAEPEYEYLVDTFQLPCCTELSNCKQQGQGWNCLQEGQPWPDRDGCYEHHCGTAPLIGNTGPYVGNAGGNDEFTKYLNNKLNDGWSLLRIIDGAAVKSLFDTSSQITCIFYKPL